MDTSGGGGGLPDMLGDGVTVAGAPGTPVHAAVRLL